MDTPKATIGSFEFDAANGQLLRGGIFVQLGSRAAAVLSVLAEARGRTVSKAELFARCWPGVFVEDGNLSVQIAALRKLLGQSETGADFILTVPRIGYRLVTDTNRTTPKIGAPVLAVAPFTVRGDPECAALEIGLRTSIGAVLGQSAGFTIAEPDWDSTLHRSAMDMPPGDFARQGIQYVLSGALQRSGMKLRLNARLLDTVSCVVLWSGQFDGTLEDSLAFSDRAAFGTAAYVESAVESGEYRRSLAARPHSLAAYDLYLKALRLHRNPPPEGYAVAFGYMMQALDQAPGNITYVSFAADLLARQISEGRPSIGSDDKQLCITLSKQVLKQGAVDPVASTLGGFALIQAGREYDLGMAAVQAAAEQGPDETWRTLLTGCTALHCGDLDIALSSLNTITALGARTPHFYGAAAGIAHIEMARGNYEASIPWSMRSLALNPAYNPALWFLIAANAHLGRRDEAQRYLADLKRIVPTASLASIANGQVHQHPERFMPVLAGMKQAGMT
jgi:DNA-binding winged helix-turn-helix (wHTH) protein/tetratricopeptide (TPR) repeat protein